MSLYRQTYACIDLSNIQKNVEKIIQKYSDYQYYFGVVKADCYGHQGIKTVEAIIKGGCNYLAVALLEEAIEIRKKFKDIPILCLGIVMPVDIPICIQNQITVTVPSFSYVEELVKQEIKGLKVHLKINTGMNRLGISSKEECLESVKVLKQHDVKVEGIYTHIYDASSREDTMKQFAMFQYITSEIDLHQIPIIHLAASETLVSYPQLDFVNGCRLGIIMYGFTKDKGLNLKSTFSLHSRIIQIHNLDPGEKVGYNGAYIAKEKERIAVVPIGYADGIIRKNKGRNVYILGKPYPIVGNICMDMLFVKIDETISVNEEVILLKDIAHIEEVARHLETIPYEVLCSIGKRVPRIYQK